MLSDRARIQNQNVYFKTHTPSCNLVNLFISSSLRGLKTKSLVKNFGKIYKLYKDEYNEQLVDFFYFTK